MQYKNTKKIILDQRKLETLFRIGCPDNLIIELLKTGIFTPTGDSLIDDNLESLIDHKIFNNNNWGGKREGAGRPKNNQDEIQVEFQDDNQDKNQDTDIDIYNNNNTSTRNSNKGGMGGKEKGGFVPPTLEEVLEYARQQNNFAGVGGFACTPEQAEEFWSYYESQGWRIGNDSNTPIRDWRPKLRQWCLKAKQIPTNQFGQRVVKMTAKEMKEAANHIKLQKMLNGEL